MATYAYQAINEKGQKLRGMIDADSPEAAADLLSARGYLPDRIQAKAAGSSNLQTLLPTLLRQRVPTAEIILFTKQFATLFRAGVPMMTMLEILAQQTENQRLGQIIDAMREDIKAGAGLFDAFNRHPHAFPPLYCHMIQAGEISGKLPSVMNRLKYILEHEQKVKADIRSALFYPIFVLVLLVTAFIVLLTVVIPQFVSILTRSGIELPLPTRISMGLYAFCAAYWPYLLTGLMAAGLALVMYLRTPAGRFTRDYTLLKTPFVGAVVIKAAMSRFASIFSILQASGIGVLDAMKILSNTIGNTAIAREFDRIRELLEEGRGIATPLRNARYFTPLVVNMVAVGEEAGNLDEMLNEVAEHYDAELEFALKKMASAIGPTLIILLAVMVGFFAVSIVMPIADLTKLMR